MRSLSSSRGSTSLVYALAFSALLIACGDDGDDKGKSPTAKCETLASTYCTRQASCWRQANNATESQERSTRDTCTSGFASGAMCSRAIDVLPSYEQCLSLIPNGSCTAFLSEDGFVPEACVDVIVTP